MKMHQLPIKMNKIIICLSMSLMLFSSTDAQVTINEDDAAGDPASELDIQSTTKGVIFPVMTVTQRDALKSPAEGLIIFNRSAGGYHNVYDGNNWQQINRTIIEVATNPSTAGTDIGVGVGIADPDNSAILHVNDTLKGFLLPRSATGLPTSPVTGLMIYNKITKQVTFYDGSDWNDLSYTSSSTGATGANAAAGVLIGTGTIDASAKMEVKTSAKKGLLIPRMTDAQRNAIESPAEGLTIYNTTANQIQYFAAATWFQWSNTVTDYGETISNPGLSCKDIYDNNGATPGTDGTYFIDPDGAGGNAPYECYCDMTRNGGGWTLVVNTGPKNTVNTATGSIGAKPILPSQSGYAKFTDADVNLLRGTASTSIMWIERQNSCQPTKSIYFKSPLTFNSAATNANNIQTYHITYADAVSGANLQTATSPYGSAFDSWSGGTSGYQIIYSYNAEGFITNGCNSTSVCTANNRSECNVLLWIKDFD